MATICPLPGLLVIPSCLPYPWVALLIPPVLALCWYLVLDLLLCHATHVLALWSVAGLLEECRGLKIVADPGKALLQSQVDDHRHHPAPAPWPLLHHAMPPMLHFGAISVQGWVGQMLLAQLTSVLPPPPTHRLGANDIPPPTDRITTGLSVIAIWHLP